MGLIDDLHDEYGPVGANLELFGTNVLHEPLTRSSEDEDLVRGRPYAVVLAFHLASMTEYRHVALPRSRVIQGESIPSIRKNARS